MFRMRRASDPRLDRCRYCSRKADKQSDAAMAAALQAEVRRFPGAGEAQVSSASLGRRFE
jgi:hypothetical protein